MAGGPAASDPPTIDPHGWGREGETHLGATGGKRGPQERDPPPKRAAGRVAVSPAAGAADPSSGDRPGRGETPGVGRSPLPSPGPTSRLPGVEGAARGGKGKDRAREGTGGARSGPRWRRGRGGRIPLGVEVPGPGSAPEGAVARDRHRGADRRRLPPGAASGRTGRREGRRWAGRTPGAVGAPGPHAGRRVRGTVVERRGRREDFGRRDPAEPRIVGRRGHPTGGGRGRS